MPTTHRHSATPSQRLLIDQFMITEFITLSPDMEIGRAARLLMNQGIAGAPVSGPTGQLVGIITKRDCFKAALNAAYHGQWGGMVERYMTLSPETLEASTNIIFAAERFVARPYRMFPVTREGSLAGILTRSDLLRAFLDAPNLPVQTRASLK